MNQFIKMNKNTFHLSLTMCLGRNMANHRALSISCILICLVITNLVGGTSSATDSEDWKSLFNGENLDGWIPKFSGSPVGENYLDTFIADEGVLKVDYSNYEQFANRYGHLFYKLPFSHYHLRLEYRFTGEKLPDSPWWTHLNSGVMIHAQSPQSMRLIPDPMGEEVAFLDHFPKSVECQLLGAPQQGKMDVPTANACQIYTTINHDGVPATQRNLYSSSKGHPAGEWVKLDVIVRGSHEVEHRIGGETVMRYSNIRDAETGKPIESGYISLQAESQPVEFRNIKLRKLPESHEPK